MVDGRPVDDRINELSAIMEEHMNVCQTGCKSQGWAMHGNEYFNYFGSGLPQQMQGETHCPTGRYFNQQMYELHLEQRIQPGEPAEEFWIRKKKEDNQASSSGEVWMNENSLNDMPRFLKQVSERKSYGMQKSASSQWKKNAPDPHSGPKKVPNDSKKPEMEAHIKSCKHPNCYSVWSGKWGSFIGGKQGAQYFDFTDCVVGKKINLEVGWDY